MKGIRPFDIALAAGLTLLVQLEVLTTAVEGDAVDVLLALGVTLPVLFARLHPLPAALISTAAIVALRLASGEQEPQTVLIVMLYCAFCSGAHAARPVAQLGGLAVWAGILVTEASDFVVLGPLTGGAWAAGRLLRSYRLQADRLRALTAELERERADHARLAIAEERARIARELHDVVAHGVSVMVMQAGAERLAIGEQRPQTSETLASIEHSGRQALVEMRRLLDVLRADQEPPELAPAPTLQHLDALVDHVRRAGLPVDLSVEGDAAPVPAGLDVTAYRIVQEALTNVLKHAGDARARVVVRHMPRALELEVSDDGAGIASADRNGHGQVGMRERAALFGGSVEAGPQPGGGYRVRARLPIERAVK